MLATVVPCFLVSINVLNAYCGIPDKNHLLQKKLILEFRSEHEHGLNSNSHWRTVLLKVVIDTFRSHLLYNCLWQWGPRQLRLRSLTLRIQKLIWQSENKLMWFVKQIFGTTIYAQRSLEFRSDHLMIVWPMDCMHYASSETGAILHLACSKELYFGSRIWSICFRAFYEWKIVIIIWNIWQKKGGTFQKMNWFKSLKGFSKLSLWIRQHIELHKNLSFSVYNST